MQSLAAKGVLSNIDLSSHHVRPQAGFRGTQVYLVGHCVNSKRQRKIEKCDHFSRNHFKFMIMSALFGHCISEPLYCYLFQLAAPTRAKLLKNVPQIKQVSAGGSNCAVVTGG